MSEKIKVEVYEDLPVCKQSDIWRVMYIEQFYLGMLDTENKKKYTDSLAHDPRLEHLHKLIWKYIDYKVREFDNIKIIINTIEEEKDSMDHIQWYNELDIDRMVRNIYSDIQRESNYKTKMELIRLLQQQ